MTDCRFSIITPKGQMSHAKDLAEALEALKGSDTVWLDYFNPTADELKQLIEPLHLHPLSIEDCLDDEQIPKIDLLPDYTFLLFNAFRCEEGALVVEEVDFLLGKNFLVTVHRSASPDRLLGAKLDHAIALDLSNVRKGPDLLFHIILDYVVDEKLRAIETLQDGLELSQERILNDTASFSPHELMRLRRDVLSMRKSLLHEREVVARLCRRDSPFVTEKAIFAFRDIHDHLARFFEVTEICREMISSDMEIYLSIINNRMSMVANRTNRVMRRLTLITTIFMPMTLLAGVGGMSEWSMMTGAENWKTSYPAFIAIIALIGVVNYWILQWLDRRDARVEQSEEFNVASDSGPAAAARETAVGAVSRNA